MDLEIYMSFLSNPFLFLLLVSLVTLLSCCFSLLSVSLSPPTPTYILASLLIHCIHTLIYFFPSS